MALLRIDNQPDCVIIRLGGDWSASAAVPSADEVMADPAVMARPGAVIVDGSALSGWNASVPAFIFALGQRCLARGIELRRQSLPSGVDRLIDGIPPPARRREHPASRRSVALRLGAWGREAGAGAASAAATLGETLIAMGAALRPGGKTRLSDVLATARDAGVSALGIVMVVNALVGGILAFVGVVQLERFGAQIFLADLVGIASAREMAAIMTAIIMAGRTGAAYAAHIATMQGNEEVDALKTLGISPVEYLVVPRVIALTLMMPVLYVYACTIAILGGMVVAVITSDLSVHAYLERTETALAYRHIAIGLSKAIVFGALIAIVGCHKGLVAGRSAADVGRAATSAVVVAIVGIIMVDALFALCTNALNI